MAQIILSLSDIKSEIKSNLSVIGKRLYTKDGKNLFSNITLSSAEETNMLSQYILSSAQDIEAALRQFIESFTPSLTTITIVITNTRVNDTNFGSRTQNMMMSYIALNTVGEYLSMVHPELSAKYFNDARQRMEALLVYVYHKEPPITPLSSLLDFVDPVGEVTEGGVTQQNNAEQNNTEDNPEDNTEQDNN